MTDVRCADCGFLCVRHPETRGLTELEGGYRHSDNYTGEIVPLPMCCAMEEQFAKGVKDQDQDRAQVLKWVVRWPRQCESFIRWRPGYSPKEHMEMSLREESDARHAEYRRLDQEWRERLQADERRWREGRERRDFVLRSVVGAATSIASAIAGGVIGYLLRGDQQK